MNRKISMLIIALVLLVPATTHAGFWSTITGWFSNNDTVYVAPTVPVVSQPQPEVLPEETSVPTTPSQQPSVPTYTPPVYLPPTTPGMTFVGGITPAQLKSAIENLRDELEPQIDRAMDSPRPRGERSDDDSISIEAGPDGYILQADGDDIAWVSPSSLSTADGTFSTTSANYWKSILNFFSTTSADYWFDQQSIPGDGTFSTTSANYWKSVVDFFSTTSADAYIAASTTIVASGNATLGDVLYWNGSRWTPLATTSLGISGGVSGYGTIQDEASSLTQRATLNFTGAGVSCVDNAGSGRTDCTIAGGGSSSDSAPYDQYDPDKPPSSCAVCDEFTGGASLSWDTTAASDLTITYDRDALHLEGSATDLWKVLWVDPPSGGNADFTISIGYTFGQSVTSDACGIAILSGGTIASPSEIKFFGMSNYSTDGMYLQFDTDYNPAVGAGTHGSAIAALQTNYYLKNYGQIRYVDSTRGISTYWSPSGFYDVPGATATLTNDPIKIGLYVRRDADCYITFFRARTDNLTDVGE